MPYRLRAARAKGQCEGKTHFISGLPGSGSTLLAALLRRNPRVHAGMSGPLADMCGAMLNEMSAPNEFSVSLDDAERGRILHALFDRYYADCKARKIGIGWHAGRVAIDADYEGLSGSGVQDQAAKLSISVAF